MSRFAAVLAGMVFLLLGAHLWRDFGILAGLAALLLLPLVFARAGWAVRVLQGALVLGALEWLRTLFVLVGERRQAGQPWGRLALILGTVALVTVAAVALLERRRRFRTAGTTRP